MPGPDAQETAGALKLAETGMPCREANLADAWRGSRPARCIRKGALTLP